MLTTDPRLPSYLRNNYEPDKMKRMTLSWRPGQPCPDCGYEAMEAEDSHVWACTHCGGAGTTAEDAAAAAVPRAGRVIGSCGHELGPDDGPDGHGVLVTYESTDREDQPCFVTGSYCQKCAEEMKSYALSASEVEAWFDRGK